MENPSQHSSFHPVIPEDLGKAPISGSSWLLYLLSVGANLGVCRGQGEVWRSQVDLLEGIRSVIEGTSCSDTKGLPILYPPRVFQ